jgi:hypothetical protein
MWPAANKFRKEVGLDEDYIDHALRGSNHIVDGGP